MASDERTGTFGAPVDVVWRVLADFESIGSWASNDR